MSIGREWMNRVRHLLGSGGFDGELDEEIRFHLETRAHELQSRGMSRRGAEERARREFGPVALVQEESREAWHFQRLQELSADVRLALRGCRRNPAFTLTAVLSLALGIGGTSAIYTAMDAALWKPLPVEKPERLVSFSIARERGGPVTRLPAPFAWQLRNSGFFNILLANADGLSFTYDGRAERITGEAVSPDYFAVLGVRPFLGQGFTSGVREGRWAPEAVLAYDFWKRRFGGDPGVIGRTIHLNSYGFTIVGVSPPGFFGLSRGTDYELRIPLLPEGRELGAINLIGGQAQGSYDVVARLRDGVRMAQAEAAADAQFQQFLRTTPVRRFSEAGFGRLRVRPSPRGSGEFLSSFQAPLYVLLALVAIVLLIACTNVANMLLARGASRAREFAIRTSIGAGRFRLVRQMLVESVMLAMLGGALALPVAYQAAGLMRFLPRGHIPLTLHLEPDGRVLLFLFELTLATGLFFGLAPALQAARGSLAGTLRGDSPAGAGAPHGARFRKVLVISQVAFSMVLLIAAGVFVRTLSALKPAEYARNAERILLFSMKPQPEIYTEERRLLLAEELLRRIGALRGVRSAALAENGPLGSRRSSSTLEIPGRTAARVGLDWVTPGFFETVGIQRTAGRDFGSGDRPGSTPVAIVNQSLASALFPNENPLGRTLRVPRGRQAANYEIVGVVTNTHYDDVHRGAEPFAWFAMTQTTPYLPTLHVRTYGESTAAIVAAIRHEFDAIDKGFPVFNIRTMSARIEDSLAGERLVANLSGAFGMLALVLAVIGLYGILAYSVSRRTREIGIRMALGARHASVVRLIVREALVVVGLGSGAGTVLALAAWRLLPRITGPVAAPGWPMVVGAIAGMFLVAAAAVIVPAMRGCRVDPLQALRQD